MMISRHTFVNDDGLLVSGTAEVDGRIGRDADGRFLVTFDVKRITDLVVFDESGARLTPG